MVLVRGVVRHEVENDPDVAGVGLAQQVIEVGQRAEDRMHVDVIGHVVAEIRHRRGEGRRQPDRVHAQPRQIVEPVSDAAQIADAVGVAVHKAARINLIDDAALPPRR